MIKYSSVNDIRGTVLVEFSISEFSDNEKEKIVKTCLGYSYDEEFHSETNLYLKFNYNLNLKTEMVWMQYLGVYAALSYGKKIKPFFLPDEPLEFSRKFWKEFHAIIKNKLEAKTPDKLGWMKVGLGLMKRIDCMNHAEPTLELSRLTVFK